MDVVFSSTSGDFLVEIFQMFLKILKRFTLCQEIRIGFQVTDPHIFILPIDVFQGCHDGFPRLIEGKWPCEWEL